MKDKIIAKQKEVISALTTYSTHVVIMWNKDLNDDEGKDIKLRLWQKVKQFKFELAELDQETTEDELYKKVYIKTKADLPKEEGIKYEVMFKIPRARFATEYWWKHNTDLWLQDIAWYRLPLKQKPTEDEYYKKVYIKSESDLPKEEGEYIVQCKYKGFLGDIIYSNYKKYGDGSHTFRYVDWYFLPLKQEPTAIEQVREAFEPIQLESKGGTDLHPVDLEQIMSFYCGNPLTSEDTCQVLAKKNNSCESCKHRVLLTNEDVYDKQPAEKHLGELPSDKEHSEKLGEKIQPSVENCDNDCNGPDCEGCRDFKIKEQQPNKETEEWLKNKGISPNDSKAHKRTNK